MSLPGPGREPSDEQLARQSAAGCSRAFAQLVGRYDRRVIRFVRRWARNEHDAEDIAQEAFVEAWRRLDRYDDRWRFSTWLYTIASRRAISHVRRAARPCPPAPHTRPRFAPPDLTIEGEEQRDRLRKLAERLLTDDQRSALWLRYTEDMSPRDIARILGRRPVAVRVMLFRARDRLAQELARLDEVERCACDGADPRRAHANPHAVGCL